MLMKVLKVRLLTFMLVKVNLMKGKVELLTFLLVKVNLMKVKLRWNLSCSLWCLCRCSCAPHSSHLPPGWHVAQTWHSSNQWVWKCCLFVTWVRERHPWLTLVYGSTVAFGSKLACVSLASSHSVHPMELLLRPEPFKEIFKVYALQFVNRLETSWAYIYSHSFHPRLMGKLCTFFMICSKWYVHCTMGWALLKSGNRGNFQNVYLRPPFYEPQLFHKNIRRLSSVQFHFWYILGD